VQHRFGLGITSWPRLVARRPTLDRGPSDKHDSAHTSCIMAVVQGTGG